MLAANDSSLLQKLLDYRSRQTAAARAMSHDLT